jgi:hypothetical protein
MNTTRMRPPSTSSPSAPGPGRPAPPPKLSEVPTSDGKFGDHGGSNVPDAAAPLLQQLSDLYSRASGDPGFWDDLHERLRVFGGRATPLYSADRLTSHARNRLSRGEGARLWLKREDLAHTGSAAINHALGFALLAARTNRRSSSQQPPAARTEQPSPPSRPTSGSPVSCSQLPPSFPG